MSTKEISLRTRFLRKKRQEFFFQWLLIFSLLSISGLYFHHNTAYFTAENRLYGEEASYYVYLPATFIYGWDVTAFPIASDTKTGNGFRLDSYEKKISTTSPYGVALMEFPFFLAAHLYCLISGEDATGFSPPYFIMSGISSAFYASISLLLLWRIVRRYFSASVSSRALFVLLAGTNYLYYVIIRPGFSHAYAFFWITVLLYALTFFRRNPAARRWTIALSIAFLSEIRFALLFSVFIPLLYEAGSFSKIGDHFRTFYTWKNLRPIILLTLLLYLPQSFYYQYLTGFFIYYTGSPFTDLFTPKFGALLFSPQSGILLFTPVIIFIFLFIPFFLKGKKHFLPAVFFFLICGYISAAWYSDRASSSYSGRWFVAYLPLFVMGMAALLHELKKTGRIVIFSLTFIFSAWNILLAFSIPRGITESAWNWKEFGYHVSSHFPVSWFHHPETFYTGFAPEDKNTLLDTAAFIKDRDSNYIALTNQTEYSNGLRIPAAEIDLEGKTRVRVSLRIRAMPNAEGCVVVVSGFSNEPAGSLFYASVPIQDAIPTDNFWVSFQKTFISQKPIYLGDELRVYLFNPRKKTLIMDDLRVCFY